MNGNDLTSEKRTNRGTYLPKYKTSGYPVANTAILIIGPVNDFLSEGAAAWEMPKATVEHNNALVHLRQLINGAHERGIPEAQIRKALRAGSKGTSADNPSWQAFLFRGSPSCNRRGDHAARKWGWLQMNLSPATPSTKEMLLIHAIPNDSLIAESAKSVIGEGIDFLSCVLDLLNNSILKSLLLFVVHPCAANEVYN